MLSLYVSILVCLCVCGFASMWYACGEGLGEGFPHAVALAMQRIPAWPWPAEGLRAEERGGPGGPLRI